MIARFMTNIKNVTWKCIITELCGSIAFDTLPCKGNRCSLQTQASGGVEPSVPWNQWWRPGDKQMKESARRSGVLLKPRLCYMTNPSFLSIGYSRWLNSRWGHLLMSIQVQTHKFILISCLVFFYLWQEVVFLCDLIQHLMSLNGRADISFQHLREHAW